MGVNMLKMEEVVLHKNENNNAEQVQMVSIEQLVPKNHILRKIDKHLDFNFIYDLVVLIKLVILQYFFNINSLRQTIREVEVNLASSVLRTGFLR